MGLRQFRGLQGKEWAQGLHNHYTLVVLAFLLNRHEPCSYHCGQLRFQVSVSDLELGAPDSGFRVWVFRVQGLGLRFLEMGGASEI